MKDKKLEKRANHTVENQLKQVLAGGVAAATARCISQPFDVLKIRFQLQVEPLKSIIPSSRLQDLKLTNFPVSSKYRTILQATSTIYREEGLLAFWKGHNPAQLLSIVYGISQFWCFEQCKRKSQQFELYKGNKNVSNFVCGAVAGIFGIITSTPLDVIRTRLIAQDVNGGYPSAVHAFIAICKNEGITGLYRGLLPSVIQIGPLTGMNFMIYKFLSSSLTKLLGLNNKNELPVLLTLCSGGIAGLTAKSLIFPLDLMKKRLQIQGFAEHHKTYGAHFECHGITNCVLKTIRQEGITGLYKGLSPSILKAAVASAFNFTIYDKIVYLLIK